MYLFFDTETTGFINKSLPSNDPKQAHICQLSAVLCDKDGNDLLVMDRIIKPTDWIIHPRLTEIHGISHEDAVTKGLPIADAFTEFVKLLNLCQILVGHNFEFDKNMVMLECDANKLTTLVALFNTKSTCCTMLNATPLCKLPKARGVGYKWPKLQEIHNFLFQADFDGAHNALFDVYATKKVFFEMMKREDAERASMTL